MDRGESHSSPSLTHFSNIKTQRNKAFGVVNGFSGQPQSEEVKATPSSKRKRCSPSLAPSANSFIGENSVQVANKDAEKFRNKGPEHYDLLHELLDGTLASGVFGQPSPLGAPMLEQERAMRNQAGNAIRMEDSSMSVDSTKRMSDGSGGTSSK